MRTISFITKYEGDRKIYTLENASSAGIISTVEITKDPKSCEKVLENISKSILTLGNSFEISDFKKFLDNEISGLDGAFVLVSSDKVFCVTYGTGAVFVRRAGRVYPLVEAGKYAKGKVLESDEFVMTTSDYLDFVGGIDGFKYYFNKYPALEVREMMETYEDQSNPSGFVALSMRTETDQDESSVQSSITGETEVEGAYAASETHSEISITGESDGELVTEKLETSTPKLTKNNLLADFFLRKVRPMNLKNLIDKFPVFLSNLRKFGIKKIIYAMIAIIAVLFLVSKIPFDKIFRDKDKEFLTFETTIRGYLSEADTASFGEISEVSGIISKARKEIDNIPEPDKKQFASQIKNLRDELNAKEKTLLKFSDKPLQEYYSVDLLGSDVEIQDVDSDNDDLVILDAKKGVVYVIGTEKRVQSNISSNKLVGATQVSIYEGRVYVLTKADGIYRVEADRSKRVVEKSNDWGGIADMKLYASNIYLLDSKKGDILKYIGIDEETFGDVSPNLVEESRGTLNNAKKMYIAGPIYVFGGSTIAKYVSGQKEDFDLVLPYSDGSLSAIAMAEESKYFYAFDELQLALFEYDEDRIFKLQYRDDKLAGSQGVYATKNGVFVVTKNQIFQVPEPPKAP